MYMLFSEYKQNARGRLKEKTLRSFRLDLVLSGVSVLSAAAAFHIGLYDRALRSVAIQMMLFVFTVVFSGSFRQGINAWQLRTAEGKRPGNVHILYWMRPNRGVRAAWLHTRLAVCRIFWTITLTSPGTAILYSAFRWRNSIADHRISMTVLLIGVICTVFGIVCSLIIHQKYALSSVILAKNPKIGIRKAAAVSQQYMTGHCFKLCLLKVSFLPHFLLCAAVFPVIYVLPYYRQTVTAMLLEILNQPIIEHVDAGK